MKNLITILSLLAVPVSVHAGELTYGAELKAIAFNESSNGLNLNHATITYGMHKGDHAGGAYGLMPNTVREVVTKDQTLNDKYSYLLLLTNAGISNVLNTDKQIDFDIAYTHWKRLRKHMGPRRAAYAWLNGPYAAAQADELTIENHWYAKKFHDALVRKFIRHEHAKNF